jgi:hypothetical protein
MCSEVGKRKLIYSVEDDEDEFEKLKKKTFLLFNIDELKKREERMKVDPISVFIPSYKNNLTYNKHDNTNLPINMNEILLLEKYDKNGRMDAINKEESGIEISEEEYKRMNLEDVLTLGLYSLQNFDFFFFF